MLLPKLLPSEIDGADGNFSISYWNVNLFLILTKLRHISELILVKKKLN